VQLGMADLRSDQPSRLEFLPQSSHPILSVHYHNWTYWSNSAYLVSAGRRPRCRTRMQAKSLPKWGPLKGPPQLASATTIVGQGIWTIMKGVPGAGAGVQEIAQFWQGKARFYARTVGCTV